MKDICKLLGNRQDQDTISGGGLLTALVNSGRILVGDDYQCLHPEQFCNLSNGKVKQWWPHAASLYCENPFVSERWALITPEDVLINVIRFKNPFSHQMSTFWNVSGNLADAKVSMWTPEKIIFSTNAFHPSVWKNTYIHLQANQPIFEGKVRGKTMNKESKLAINGGEKVIPEGMIKNWPPIDETDEKLVLDALHSPKQVRGEHNIALEKELGNISKEEKLCQKKRK